MNSIADFLKCERIAISGVSARNPEQSAANAIYNRLRTAGYRVYPINPNAEKIGEQVCYPDVFALPERPDGIVIVNRPDVAERIVEQCVQAEIERVWLHRSFGTGSVSNRAVEIGKQGGLRVIAGGCPMMFIQPVDTGHRCMRWILEKMKRIPVN